MKHPTTTLEEVREQARASGLIDSDEIDEMDFYQMRAAQFRERVQISDSDDQFKVMVEEMGEVAEALNTDDGSLGEEIADVLVTAFVLADIEDIDVREAYGRKMEYNLNKSGRMQGGKVLDDG